jgi:Heterokaryon incompatibility protein (HET)
MNTEKPLDLPLDSSSPSLDHFWAQIYDFLTSKVHFSRLPNDEDSIRLLEILPGSRDSPIRATLHVTCLSSQPSFEAISYTWGEVVDCKPIVINNDDCPVAIRHNLWTFLNVLRPPEGEGSRMVWVDALCISQFDAEEKAEQVRMIGKIFSAAFRVVAWLGEEADGSSQVVTEILTHEEIKHPAHTQLPEEMVASFFNRPFWRRAWIIEEFVVPREILFFCGSTDMCFTIEQLESYKWLFTMPEIADLNPIYPMTEYMFDLFGARDNFQSPERRRRWWTNGAEILRSLVSVFTDTRCRDPRDKIFAFLPICQLAASDQTLSTVVVNYTCDLLDLFLKVCETWVLLDNEGYGAKDATFRSARYLAIAFDLKKVDIQRTRDLLTTEQSTNPADQEKIRLKEVLDKIIDYMTRDEQQDPDTTVEGLRAIDSSDENLLYLINRKEIMRSKWEAEGFEQGPLLESIDPAISDMFTVDNVVAEINKRKLQREERERGNSTFEDGAPSQGT